MAASTLGLGSAYAATQTVTYTGSVPATFTDWSKSISIPQFNPVLGNLVDVNVTAAGAVVTHTWVESHDFIPWTVTTGSDVALTVLDPLGATLTAQAPSIRFTNDVTSFDGTDDFGGTSGFKNPDQTASFSVVQDLPAASNDLSAYIGVGSLNYAASAVGTSYFDGPGDYVFVAATKAQVAITVVYTYEPPVIIIPPTGSIGDRVWLDLDADGVQDSGEPGLKGWTVQLSQGGTVLATKTTGDDGLYLFTDLVAGTYTVTVTPAAGYAQTYDLDGLATANVATAPLAEGQNRRDVDFGYVLSPTNFPKGTGCTPGFWSNRGLGFIRPIDFAVLSALKLVDGNGADADWTNPTTGAFGAPYAANLAQADSQFATYEGGQNAVNMAAQLSRHLAAFTLNLRFGFVGTSQMIAYTGAPGGKMKASDVAALANAALIADSYTPAGDPNRAYQEALKNALADANNAAQRP